MGAESHTDNTDQGTKEDKKGRRYYWLKLKEQFFEDKYIKILRAQPNGYRIVCIYLMLQLKALKTDGMIEYARLLPSYTAELAVEIGEDESAVAEAVQTLEKFGLVELWDNDTVFLAARKELIDYGSESDSAARARRCREKKRYNVTEK